jgi:hypothetical protein
MVYFTARMYWGGKNADVDAMFREYCQLFYGPAAQEMQDFFTFCEAHWSAMEDDKAQADAALALFTKAQSKADAASVYGRRIALIDDFLKGMRMKAHQLGQQRGPVPTVRLVGDAAGIVIDGKLDDAYWQNCPVAATGRLRELQTGRAPTYGTSLKAGWQAGSVVLAIRCDERRGEKPRTASTRDDDPAIWHGDVIELEIATETHSYYQIAVSPEGHVVDLDRGVSKGQWFTWDSKAAVATHIADDHWTVEIRIPVTQDENDPLHQVIGRKPTQSLPWHINVCRQRVRDEGQEHSALSPTGTAGFHEPMKFAYFYAGRSHRFEADPSVTDFLTASRAAAQLATEKKPAEALAALVALAEGAQGKLTELQQSAALKQAAGLARTMKDYTQAEALSARIPIEAERKNAEMLNLLAQRKFSGLLEQYGGEDLTKWPFWAAGEGYYTRGRAYAAAGDQAKARDDYQAALPLLGDPRMRRSVTEALQNLQGDR